MHQLGAFARRKVTLSLHLASTSRPMRQKVQNPHQERNLQSTRVSGLSDTEREMPAEFEPTTDQRALVQNAAAFGINQADIANQLNIDEKTLRKHFREELNSGKFKVDMLAGRTVTELMKSGEERVRLDAAKYYTARRMGWKESNVSEHVGKDGGPIENKDVTARELFESRMAGIVARRAEASVPGGDDAESA
jgi:AraC-like DNA-binding protein